MAKMENLTAAPFILQENGRVLGMLPGLASIPGLKAVHVAGGCIKTRQELSDAGSLPCENVLSKRESLQVAHDGASQKWEKSKAAPNSLSCLSRPPRPPSSPYHRIIEWFGLEGTLKLIWFHSPLP